MAPHALAGRGRPVSGRTYVVRAGDTIWGIARRAVGSEGDPRPLVDLLIRVNHLEDGIIFPGERLAMPPDLKTGR